MQLNDIGAKTVCSVWASIADPRLCIAWLNNTGSGNEVDVINGYAFAQTNIATGDIVAKDQVWTLSATGGNEYAALTGTDAFTFSSGTDDTPFSIAAWIEVVAATADTRVIIGKRNTTTNREWALSINVDEKIQMQLRDETNSASCTQITTNGLSEGWHFIVATWLGGATPLIANLKIYDNGVITAMSGTECTGYDYMQNQITNIVIGAYADAGKNWKDDLGHIAVFPSEITAPQALKLYNTSKLFYGL